MIQDEALLAPESSVFIANLKSLTKGTTSQLARTFLEKRLWPVYAKSRNRKNIDIGDHLLICTREKSGDSSCWALAKICLKRGTNEKDFAGFEYMMMDVPAQTLELTDVFIKPPVSAKLLFQRAGTIPENETRWGVMLMGGFRKLRTIEIKSYLELVNK